MRFVFKRVQDAPKQENYLITPPHAGFSVKLAEPGAGNCLSAGRRHSVVLLNDGTVTEDGDNTYGQCQVQDWRDIIAVSAGKYQTVGRKQNGTVQACSDNTYHQCNVEGWNGIVAVSAGEFHTVACTRMVL